MGAAVGRLIGSFFMKPVVYLQNGVLHRHVFDAVFELIVDDRARHVESLVVDSYGEHIMTEFKVGNLLAPGHLVAGFECILSVGLEEFAGIVGHIGERHIGVEHFKTFSLLRSEVCLENLEEFRVVDFSFSFFEIRLDLRVGNLGACRESNRN